MTLGDTDENGDQSLNIHVMFNMYWEALEFEIPQFSGLKWCRAIDTALPSPNDISPVDKQITIEDNTYTLTPRSVVVLASKAVP
jgi:glycogen operon protein